MVGELNSMNVGGDPDESEAGTPSAPKSSMRRATLPPIVDSSLIATFPLYRKVEIEG